ncbi:MAG: hypothetical protein DU489_10830 [Nitrosomonas sp.]|uniref:prenyltransferase/squalene oxidase repeat-containing protein n=1 Tax=Nitrosomonas sp. TaxID=42353 RepID=UPI0032EF6DB7
MTRITEIINHAGRWLEQQQDKESKGWGERRGSHVNVLNTAEAVIALIDSGVCNAGTGAIRGAVDFLLKHQTLDGPDAGSWPRELTTDEGETVDIPDLVRTTYAIQALIKAGKGIDEQPLQLAFVWLLGRRNENTKGWGYARGKPDALMPTCFALNALLDACDAYPGAYQTQIQESLQHLVEAYYHEGGDEVRGSFGAPGPLQGIHTIYAALVLQIARANNLSRYPEQEKQAIEWLLRNPDRAIRLREEWVEIDQIQVTDGQTGGYGFMVMADTLLMKLLLGSESVDDKKSALAHEAMHSLKDKIDESSGAFYGPRLFSWATAKALSALAVMQKHAGAEYPDLPARTPESRTESGGWKTGPVIIGFVTLLSGLGFYLMVNDKFGLLEFSFFVVMMLAALLAYGAIGEKTFSELFGSVGGLLKKGK